MSYSPQFASVIQRYSVLSVTPPGRKLSPTSWLLELNRHLECLSSFEGQTVILNGSLAWTRLDFCLTAFVNISSGKKGITDWNQDMDERGLAIC